MRLTAAKLQLFDKPGKGAAANAISAAVTKASKDAIRTIGRRYSESRAAQAIAGAFHTTVHPVLMQYAHSHGACDSEPRSAAGSEMVRRIAKRYGLDSHEDDSLYYAAF